MSCPDMCSFLEKELAQDGGVGVGHCSVCEHCEQARDGKVNLDMDLALPCTLKSLILRCVSTCVRNKNR